MTLKISNLFAAVAIVGGLLVTNQASAQAGGPQTTLQGFAASPVLVRQNARAGAADAIPITIENYQSSDLTVGIVLESLTPAPWNYGPEQNVTNPHDCSGWFAAKENSMVIPSAQKKTLNLKFKVPAGSSGVYWCIATLGPNFHAQPDKGISIKYQIPIILFVGTIPRANLRITPPLVTFTDPKAAGPKKLEVIVPMENIGEGFAIIGTLLELRDGLTGRIIETGKVEDRNLFPDSKRALAYEFRLPDDGRYLVVAKNQIGTRTMPPQQTRFALKDQKLVDINSGPGQMLSPIESKSQVNVSVMPGITKTSTIRFTSGADHTVTVNLTAHSLIESDSGAFEAGPPLASQNVTVVIDTPQITMDPQGSEVVPVEITVPAGATGDQWFCILADIPDGKTLPAQVNLRASVPKTEQPSVHLKSLGITTVRGHPSFAAFEVENTGNVALRPFLKAVVNGGPQTVWGLEVPLLGDGGILPGTKIKNRVQIPLKDPATTKDIEPGKYAVVVTCQYGDGPDMTKTLTIPFTIGGSG